MKGKKVRRYLAYAAGEILLVVVGILIALQFNDADIDRQDREKEKASMVSMLGDLESDVVNIDIAIEGNQILLDGLEELVRYFHVVEARQKLLFDLSLGKNAYELIEQDYMNMLLPDEQFSGLIDEGTYLIDSDPKTLQAYYGDVLFYRTTINNTNAFLTRQKELAGSLSKLILERYGTGK